MLCGLCIEPGPTVPALVVLVLGVQRASVRLCSKLVTRVTPLIFKPIQRLDFEPNLKPEPILALKIQDANLKFASGKRSVKVLPGNHTSSK